MLGGACTLDVARITVPAELVEGLGIVKVDPEGVVMHPSLVEL